MKTVLALLLLALVAGQALAQGNSRESSYKGAAGSGQGFKDAKRGLLDEYSKIKKVQWKADAEKLGADTYYLKYSFPTKADLEDFQAWQYKQPKFTTALDKFSLKPKGNSNVTGRKLAL